MSDLLKDESVDWKALALYLLDCEAATAQRMADLKSAPKREKRRHADICLAAIRALTTGLPPQGARVREADRVLQRASGAEEICREAAQ